MDTFRVKQILLMLAEGVDPITGEIFPEDHVCNNVEVIRALYTALGSVKITEVKNKKSLAKPRTVDSRPLNAGKHWDEEEDRLLCQMFDAGASNKEICFQFQRTVSGVASRLKRLGKIEDRDEFRNRE